MRNRAWRRQQNRKKRRGQPSGCTCVMCKPHRYNGLKRHSDLKKTAEHVRDLELRYLDEKSELNEKGA